MINKKKNRIGPIDPDPRMAFAFPRLRNSTSSGAAMQQRVIGWWPINERICSLRIRGRFFNLSIINVHSTYLGSTDDDKELFYKQLEREYDSCPKHDVKIVIGDLNAEVGQEEAYRPKIGSFSVQQSSQS